MEAQVFWKSSQCSGATDPSLQPSGPTLNSGFRENGYAVTREKERKRFLSLADKETSAGGLVGVGHQRKLRG